MSKIYDALRKAEQSKKKIGGKPKGNRRIPVKSISAGRAGTFLQNMDDDFRRSLRNLRNSIDTQIKNEDSRVIMFTSSVKGEGKTTITAFLARVIALGETDKVLLIDCAVDNPELHKLFGVDNEKGIIEYLSGRAKLEDIIHTIDENVMDLITSGQRDSSDVTQPLFNSALMANLIREVSQYYDYVLIDTSAALEAAETPIIGSYAEGTVIIIQAGKTKREVIKRAIMLIEKHKGTFLGTVLNRKKYYIPEFIYKRV
ncbi:MAG: CpsD/CapB family tyrosine-protein kinase [Candidatus Krumholzibacteriota bacterium]|nr:CpsD/CapB family tyrosine-protein kinase [Candidatus Krumholzibacteriota bacterium]